MTKPERSVYKPTDFLAWRETDGLVLTPKFQRRDVWTLAARSFFIDTLIRGMPVPPLYLRTVQSRDSNRVVREVVDGQQRVSAILDFLDDSYRLSKSLGSAWAGKSFSALTDEQRASIRNYSFSVEIFQGISDLEVLEVFSRLNTYSVPLNAQELRNGKYFGFFKRTVMELAHEHLEFWRTNRIFSERSIARMLEIEFTSEIMIAMLAGMQDKKKSIDDFYGEYDEHFREATRLSSQMRDVFDDISEVLGDQLATSEFHRPR